MADQSVDVDAADVASTPASPMSTAASSVTSGALDFFGGTLRVGTAAQDALAGVLGSGAGPAVVLLVVGMALAMFARKRR